MNRSHPPCLGLSSVSKQSVTNPGANNTALLITFQRPTGVTRHLSRIPADTDVVVVAFDEKAGRQLAIYERKEWCEQKEVL